MSVVNLSWYTSAVLLLGSILVSFITFIPDAESSMNRLPLVFVIASAVAAMSAVILHRKPANHWVHTSKPFHTLFVVIASFVTLVVLMIGESGRSLTVVVSPGKNARQLKLLVNGYDSSFTNDK